MPGWRESTGTVSPPPTAGRRPRVFRNSYTRAGRRFTTNGWVVKLQHQGRRRTLSLQSATKSAAVLEAKAIFDTLSAGGWEAVLRSYPNQNKSQHNSLKSGLGYWRERLLARRYPFPATGGAEGDLAIRIDHAGIGSWFPLGTADLEIAAVKARRIYETVLAQGWGECCRQFSRELILGFEWCSNPILWTYTTIHTIVTDRITPSAKLAAVPHRHPVLIVEQDAGVRRALEWSVNRHNGFRSVLCRSIDSFARELEASKPHLVLFNRNLAERLGNVTPGQIAPLRGDVLALPYSVAGDGDQLFVSTPGGAEGYFIKRVKPDRLLEPILEFVEKPDSQRGAHLYSVKSYFGALLRPRMNPPASGLGRLTRREHEVLALLSKGRVDKEIAQILGISAWTVHGHIKSIFERLQVRTRTEAVVRYLER